MAVTLDAFFRRVMGWALGRTIDDSLTLTAPGLAVSRGSVRKGLVHHSGRGSQYASGGYTTLLEDNGIEISMSSIAIWRRRENSGSFAGGGRREERRGR